MKRTLLFAGLAVVSGMALAAAKDSWLVEEGKLRLGVQELEQVIEHNVPEQERQLWLNDRAKYNNLVTEYFMLKQLEQEGLHMGLDQEPAMRSKLELERLRTLANEVMRRKLDAQPEPDFEQAARETYEINRSSFRSQDEVHARHILVAVNDARSDEQARARALEARQKLVEQPDSFTALVTEYSDDPGAVQNKGDLGFFAAGRMVKPFATAAFALQQDEISQPVRSEFGYHVIQLLDKRAGRQLEFADVRDRLVSQERAAFKKRQREDLIQHIQLREGVEYNLPAVDALYEKITTGNK